MQQQTKIIIFLIGLFFLSSVFLFFINDKYLNSESQKNYWVVYFSEPKNSSLDFVIENHSQQNNFHWEVSQDGNKLTEGNANLNKGSIKNIDLNNISGTGKMTVSVSDGNEKKEIYKNFEK